LDTELSYLSLLDIEDNFDSYMETAMTICLQRMEFGNCNIVLLVKYNSCLDSITKKLSEIASGMEYELEWVNKYKLRVGVGQSYLIIESILDKYKGTDFVMVPILRNESLEKK